MHSAEFAPRGSAATLPFDHRRSTRLLASRQRDNQRMLCQNNFLYDSNNPWYIKLDTFFVFPGSSKDKASGSIPAAAGSMAGPVVANLSNSMIYGAMFTLIGDASQGICPEFHRDSFVYADRLFRFQ